MLGLHDVQIQYKKTNDNILIQVRQTLILSQVIPRHAGENNYEASRTIVLNSQKCANNYVFGFWQRHGPYFPVYWLLFCHPESLFLQLNFWHWPSLYKWLNNPERSIPAFHRRSTFFLWDMFIYLIVRILYLLEVVADWCCVVKRGPY